MKMAALCAPADPDPQTAGTGGTLDVTVLDPSGATVSGAQIKLSNKVTGFARSIQAGAAGNARITNLAPNQYHLEVSSSGFQTYTQDVMVRGPVPVAVSVALKLAEATEQVD